MHSTAQQHRHIHPPSARLHVCGVESLPAGPVLSGYVMTVCFPAANENVPAGSLPHTLLQTVTPPLNTHTSLHWGDASCTSAAAAAKEVICLLVLSGREYTLVHIYACNQRLRNVGYTTRVGQPGVVGVEK